MDIKEYQEKYAKEGGFNSYAGLRIAKIEPGSAVIEVDIEPHHMNPEGIVHGGMIFTLCDMAAGVATGATEQGRRRFVTMQASIHYLRPARGGRLRAVGRLIKDGRTTALAEAEVFDENDKLLVKGEFTEYFI